MSRATRLAPILLALVAGRLAAQDGAADALALSDGQVAYGQFDAAGPGGEVDFIVRRAWAARNLPDWAARWSAEEYRRNRRAKKDRRDRLDDWRADRLAGVGRDAIVEAVESESARMADGAPPRTLLMAIRLRRAEFRALSRRPAGDARLVRLAWRSGLDSAEVATGGELADELDDLRVERAADDPVQVDDLLPLLLEPEGRWSSRRAATEATADPALRYVRVRRLILAEDLTGEPPPEEGTLLDAPASRAAFASINEVVLDDPLDARLRDAAAVGCVGLISTRLDFDDRTGVATAESTLWGRRRGGEAWTGVLVRVATAEADLRTPLPAFPSTAGRPIAAALATLESVSSYPLSAETAGLSWRSAEAGAVALRKARVDLDRAMRPLILEGVLPGRGAR